MACDKLKLTLHWYLLTYFQAAKVTLPPSFSCTNVSYLMICLLFALCQVAFPNRDAHALSVSILHTDNARLPAVQCWLFMPSFAPFGSHSIYSQSHDNATFGSCIFIHGAVGGIEWGTRKLLQRGSWARIEYRPRTHSPALSSHTWREGGLAHRIPAVQAASQVLPSSSHYPFGHLPN